MCNPNVLDRIYTALCGNDSLAAEERGSTAALIELQRLYCKISIGSQFAVQIDQHRNQRYDYYTGCPALLIRLKRDTQAGPSPALCVCAHNCRFVCVLHKSH